MHTATLLHDDVVDESDYRRGKKSARLVWGNQASVLVGDFLLGQAFRMMVDVGSLPALKILSDAAAVIAEGEVMQLAAAKNTATTEDEYLAIINAKTAALFSAAAEVGAAIAKRPAEEQAALKSYGRNLGIAFQLVDDALDYSGDSAGSASRSATISARARSRCRSSCASAAAARTSAPSGTARWSDGKVEDGDLEQAIGLMKKHSAIEATLERARHYGADRPAMRWPSSRRTATPSALTDVIGFCVSRAS